MEPKPKKLDIEDVCKNVVHKQLKNSPTFRNAEWKKYPNGKNSPPDFNLILDDKTLAVEVTIITTIRRDGVDQISDETYQVSRLKLVDELTRTALKLGILKGRYVINFHMDWLVSLKKARRQLENQVFDYVQKSRDKERESAMVIRYEQKRVCEVCKLDNKDGRIWATFTDAQWSESPEVQLNTREMVQRAVSSKATKLRNGNIPHPWALVLYNANPFASEINFKKCEDQIGIEGKELFDWIFIVTSLDSGFDLYLRSNS
jgi:hypothetical protein